MRSSIPLALCVMLAAGCRSDDDQVVPPCVPGIVFERLPVAGLSNVEASSEQPEQIALLPNPALIDGDVASSAGVNLGFSPSLGGDFAFRDMGLQLADATAVNELRVWVDQALPPQVSGAYSWSAYRSDDNLTWAAIALAGPVRFGLVENRFEVPIARTEARYLKLVTRPLAVGVTANPAFESVLVTEMEGFLVAACETP